MKEPVLLQIDRVKVADVIVRDRLRPVSEAAVESLLESVRELGVLKDAIHVGKKKDGKLVLIAGAHRIAMARRLGWEDIQAKVWDRPTDDWMRLMEIDDNLAGAEMTALDTAIFLATRKNVYERVHPQAKAMTGAELAAKRWDAAEFVSVASFAKTTAEKFGLTERHIRNLIMAGRGIAPDQAALLRAAEKPVTLKDLLDLSKVGNAVERNDAIRARAEGRARSISEALRLARPASVLSAEAKQDADYLALVNAWKRAGVPARRRFAEEYAKALHEAQSLQGLDDSEGGV